MTLKKARAKSKSTPISRILMVNRFPSMFFLAVLVAVLGLFLWVISPFLPMLIYAGLIVVLFHPVHDIFLEGTRQRAWLAAIFSTLFVVLVVLTPLALFAVFTVQQAVDAYALFEAKWQSLHFGSDQAGLLAQSVLDKFGVGQLLATYESNVLSFIKNVGQSLSEFLVNQTATVVKGVGSTVLAILVLLLSVFYFFRDGDRILAYLKKVIPFPGHYEDEIIGKLKETIYGIVVGSFGTSILQGLIGGLGFAIAGVPNVVFWGALMAFTSLIPYVGAAIIWLPMTLALYFQGEPAWALFMGLWGLIAVSSADNFFRAMLIGGTSKMHPLLTFLTVLGGLLLFGIKGVVYGPLILSLTLTVMHLYQMEYKEVLE
jgi:predicted PurR-regulated permease PerM